MRSLGGNCIRVYFPPPTWILDEALKHGLRVFIDVPWEKHRCFLEDWDAQQRTIVRIRETAAALGRHPGVFAISVGNEIPVDVVRYSGRTQVERFLEGLVEEAKAQAPDCPVTYVNFPTTEFLLCRNIDFHCFNVYLHEEMDLGAYLGRLQHIAGNKPLILGEYGIDTLREGEEEQARCLANHLRCVSGHGLAGSCVFAYTDDWFTGGTQIDDWTFGITRRDRSEKESAAVIRNAWQRHPLGARRDLPKVSVVICSYNGAKTLPACLQSLMNLDYPDFEVILVDDGSTDRTPRIADEFPQIIYHRQANLGLSAARNVGAWLSTGDVVAYTDDDCVADEHWLTYLVCALEDQGVEAIGGPNLTPEKEGWVAQCVAVSPGNPSHVMLDDRHAEHVPGCNMAFRRKTLMAMGGFDPQFRVAGDDVDICWRFLDAGLPIGYAPGAMVWHHRRSTISAYARQQRGYGRSESMIYFKHPQRCANFGRSRWKGVIYGAGAIALPLLPDRIYHGCFGSGLFQTIYRHNHYRWSSVTMSLEWHLLAVCFLLLSVLARPLLVVSAGMEVATLSLAIRSGFQVPLPRQAPWWCRPLIAYLHLMQPVWRGWTRLTHLLRNRRLQPAVARSDAKRISVDVCDLYWDNHAGLGRNHLLPRIVERAKAGGWAGDYDNAWASWDIRLVGDRWHDITIRTATEELGGLRRFTRARCSTQMTRFSGIVVSLIVAWSLLASILLKPWAMGIGLLLSMWVLWQLNFSRRCSLRAASSLVGSAARISGFETSCGATDARSPPPSLRGGASQSRERQTDAVPAGSVPEPAFFADAAPISDVTGQAVP
ncbi:MAG: glycosyltransferase [Planctomycetaceae bacterium]